jgi:uncharacterized membrane protein YgdD (TMEM256/DUF423 family)
MNSQQYRILAFVSFFGITGIALGAMGAHFLKNHMDAENLNHIETGVRYQVFHALALAMLIGFGNKLRPGVISAVFYTFTAGIFCFSFSLYLLAFTWLLEVTLPKPVFLITPVGGLLLVAGWAILFINSLRGLYKRRRQKEME